MRGVKTQFSFGLSLARRMDIRFDVPGPIWTPEAVPIPLPAATHTHKDNAGKNSATLPRHTVSG